MNATPKANFFTSSIAPIYLHPRVCNHQTQFTRNSTPLSSRSISVLCNATDLMSSPTSAHINHKSSPTSAPSRHNPPEVQTNVCPSGDNETRVIRAAPSAPQVDREVHHHVGHWVWLPGRQPNGVTRPADSIQACRGAKVCGGSGARSAVALGGFAALLMGWIATLNKLGLVIAGALSHPLLFPPPAQVLTAAWLCAGAWLKCEGERASCLRPAG